MKRFSVSRNLGLTSRALSEKEFIVEKLTGDDEGIVVWGLNRPSRKNAMGRAIMTDIHEAFEDIRVSFFNVSLERRWPDWRWSLKFSLI